MYNLQTISEKIKCQYPLEKIKVLVFTKVKEPFVFKCMKCGEVTRLTSADGIFKKGRKTLCQKCPENYSTKDKTREVLNKVDFVLTKCANLQVLFLPSRITEDMQLKCLKCQSSFKRKPQVFLKSQKCPVCESRSKLKTNEVFLEDLKERYGESYLPIDEYKSATEKIRVKHSCGFIYSTTPHNLLSGKECPRCSKRVSKGEKAVRQFLEKNQLNFEFQHRIFPEGKNPLIVDFYLPNHNLIIEFNGIQHYEPVSYFGGEVALEKQRQRDELKKDYCKNNSISLLVIKYTDNIEEVLTSYFGGSTTISKESSIK